ncbi:MAG: hypothetical protein JSV54_06550 [Chloroflexota bacterium]|nr:MAG: hypothetical protein JSV54_06550 [Chloroflexota bacterium]
MSDKDFEKTKKVDCCDQKDCCPSSSDNTTQQSAGSKKWWKIAVFALGMLMIIGATSYSLITRHINASSAPLDNGGIPQIGSEQNIPNILGLSDLTWVQNLSTTFTEHDFMFVILPDSDSDSTKTLTNRVIEATATIEARGARVETITLSPDNSEFSTTMHRLAIGQVPAVLAISVSGNGAIMTGDITEEKLLQTYLVVSQPPVCPPGSSPGCCGGK